jgi:hypothetical protein
MANFNGKSNNYISNRLNAARNAMLNITGVERDFEQLLHDRDVNKALSMCQCRDEEAWDAIKEYDPELHEKVMLRPDKQREDRDVYLAEKLPIPLQKHINETEGFFLLDRAIEFRNDTEVPENEMPANEEAYSAFLDVIKETRFNTTIREAKRFAGSETECAKHYRIEKSDAGELYIAVNIMSNSKGFRLRPLFDQYGTLLAFGWGYEVKDGAATIKHYDIETSKLIYECVRRNGGWDVNTRPNLTGKINVIYYRQDKAWNGVQRLIERLELIYSKIADVNNYFSSPKLVVNADLIKRLPDSPNITGEVINVRGTDVNALNAVRYLEFPTAPELQKNEIINLIREIRLGSGTPPMEFEDLVGLGTLSSEAMQKAMVLGYIKRNNLIEIYDIAVKREISLILAIMANVTHIKHAEQLNKMDISFSFADPFPSDENTHWKDIAELYKAGTISLETAVRETGLYENLNEEIEMISNKSAINIQEL